MRKKQKIMNVLMLVQAIAVFVGIVLWMVKIGKDQADGIALLGTTLSLVNGASFFALMVFRRKQQEETEQERERQQAELALAHKEQLREVRRTAQEEMENFRSTMVHSLRMPVAIIQGYSELLAGDMVKDPEVRREYMDKIVQRSQYMSEVMSRNFAADQKLSCDTLNYSEVDLLHLVGHVVMDVHKVAKEKGVVIQIVSAEDTVVMEADEYLLNRVIFNLLENSLKYMGRPGVVTIRVQKEGEWVNIRVQDDGLGLASEEAERVFENRFQGSNRMGGNGYGLHLVKRTVEAHGGEVYAQSAFGQGMRIVMKFPLKCPAKA